MDGRAVGHRVEVLRHEALEERRRVRAVDDDETTTDRSTSTGPSIVTPAASRERRQVACRGRRGEQRPAPCCGTRGPRARVGVGDDPGAGLHARPAAAPHHRADRDRGVEVAGEVEVADDPGVRAALHRLELVDDLHRPHLGRAADRARRGTSRAARRPRSGRRRGRPTTWRREVHDVRVALERHELIDLLGPELHDPADVVAGQVDEHHVLGPLLGVLAELGGEPPVVLLAAAAEAGAGDRPADDPARRAPAPSARATSRRAWPPRGAGSTCTATG